MSKLTVKLEVATRDIDWDKLLDIMHDMAKECEKLEAENKDLRDSIERYDELTKLKEKGMRNDMNWLKSENAQLRSKIAELEGDI